MHSLWNIKDSQTLHNDLLPKPLKGRWLQRNWDVGMSEESSMKTRVYWMLKQSTKCYNRTSRAPLLCLALKNNIQCFTGTWKKTTEPKMRHHHRCLFVSTALKNTESTSLSAISIFNNFTPPRELPLRTAWASSLTALLKKNNHTKTHTYFRFIFELKSGFHNGHYHIL